MRKTSTTADRGQNQRSKASNLEKIETVEREKQLKLLVSSEKSEEKDYPCENFFKRYKQTKAETLGVVNSLKVFVCKEGR